MAENIAAHTELDFNKNGYIPIFSSVTGGMRIINGMVHVIIGISKIIFAVQTDIFRNFNYRNKIFKGFYFTAHGISNILRGAIELIPVVGNIAMIIYDIVMPRFKYDLEYKKQITEGETFLIQYEDKSFWLDRVLLSFF